jgi:3-polyprenyl-4-hydroxybenzoate decarboxylase
MVTVIQLDVDGMQKPYPFYGKKVGMALATYGAHITSTYIIVVGPDINPRDPMDVWWAMGMYTLPVTDQIAITDTLGGGGGAVFGSYSGTASITKSERGLYSVSGQQIIIDATTPIPERYDAWQPRTEPPDWEKAAIERIKNKLGDS